MENDPVKNFMTSAEEAAFYLKTLSFEKATIVHHNDTDGIASGALLKGALQREGFQTENIPLERIHPSFITKIHTPDRKLILYADFGGQGAGLINKNVLRDSSMIILDHHPPFECEIANLLHINPEIWGIDGDVSCSGATVAYFFGRALNQENEDLAYLGVLGAIGDNQVVEGRMTGLNQMVLEIATWKKSILWDSKDPEDPYRFRLFEKVKGRDLSRFVSDLSVNGYYRKGGDLAIHVCLNGLDDRSKQFALEMRAIQEARFRKEREKVKMTGVPSEGDIQWIDVEDRFYPLGVKSIGIFCSEMNQTEWMDADKYIVGFQDFPSENPYVGKFHGEETKVSMRVPPLLLRAIEQGGKPNLSEILPKAAEEVEGFAEGCHRYTAACTIPKKKKRSLIQSLQRVIKEKSKI
jgi:single-stranded-DNA-specific exonuclease